MFSSLIRLHSGLAFHVEYMPYIRINKHTHIRVWVIELRKRSTFQECVYMLPQASDLMRIPRMVNVRIRAAWNSLILSLISIYYSATISSAPQREREREREMIIWWFELHYGNNFFFFLIYVFKSWYRNQMLCLNVSVFMVWIWKCCDVRSFL